jgi:hypothetical protein
MTITVEEIDRRAIKTVRLRSDRPFAVNSDLGVGSGTVAGAGVEHPPAEPS